MIKENIKKIFDELPNNVDLVLATKSRSVFEIEEAISAGAKIIGENYVKEAEEKFKIIGNRVKWHLIGHLQRNKAKRAVRIFDMIETLDSIQLAEVLDKECKKINKIIPVLIEINSGYEASKTGIFAEDLENFIREALNFKNLKLMGLMTIGPLVKNPQDIRPFFRKTKELFEEAKKIFSNNKDWIYLSMGMSSTYKIAIQEGANIVRIGSAIFGHRAV